MNTVNKVLTYIAIVCVLIMATMCIVSADSWTPNGESDGYIYQPYINFDFLEMIDQSGNRYVLDLNTVVESLPNQQAAGYQEILFFDFTTTEGTISVPINIRFTDSSSTDNLICQIRIDFSEFDNEFDSPTFRFISSDQICNTTWLTSDYVPGIRLYSPDYEYPSFNMSYSASVTYFETNRSNSSINRKFVQDSTFSGSWLNLSNSGGRTSIYRVSNINNAINSKQNENKQYISQNGSLNSVLVNDYQVDITTGEYISSLMIYLPYVKTQPTYSQYLDGFSFGSSLQTSIQTSFITSIVEVKPDYDEQYTSFTDWLIVAVGGFMDFGFWGISIGAILGTIILFKVVKALLDYFSGG